MKSGTKFAGAMAWCKKYNLCFISEYRYMKRAMDRLEEEERLIRVEGEMEVKIQEVEVI